MAGRTAELVGGLCCASSYCAVFVCRKTNDGGCVNDQELRDFTNQFLDIPSQPTLQHGSCSSQADDGDCSVQKSHYGSPEDRQNFTYTVINPAFTGTMRGIRVVRQAVLHHRSTVKVGIDCWHFSAALPWWHRSCSCLWNEHRKLTCLMAQTVVKVELKWWWNSLSLIALHSFQSLHICHSSASLLPWVDVPLAVSHSSTPAHFT